MGCKMAAMFDIFTTEQDGKPVLLDSTECLAEAEQRAIQLSRLFPGEHFAYFERTDRVRGIVVMLDEGGRVETVAQNAWSPSVAFLA
jgi:hypothetical protein